MSTPATSQNRDLEPSETRARAIVTARSGGLCEGCGAPGTEWSHRLARSQQGLWLPSNGLRMDRRCHSWLHANPIESEAAGWRTLSITGEHPATLPAWIRSTVHVGWHLLGDDGTIEPLWGRDDTPELPPWCLSTALLIPAGKSPR